MALTKITQGVIKSNENYNTHNINSTGIITATELDVNGNADISGNLNVGGVLTYDDVTNIDSVGVITARSEIHTTGDVGIGTNNPQRRLDIFEDDATDTVVQIRSGTGNREKARITKVNRTTGNGDLQIQSSSGGNGHSIVFLTDSSGEERMHIGDDGGVGIGTNNPATNFKLDVNGDLSLGELGGSDNTYIDQKQNGHLNIINSGTQSNSGKVRINKTNSIGGDTTYFRDFEVYDGKDKLLFFVDGSSSRIGVGTDSFNDAAEVMRVQAISSQPNTLFTIKANSTSGQSILNFGDDDFNEGRIIYDHSDNSMQFRTNDAERLRITSGGKIQVTGTRGGTLQSSDNDSLELYTSATSGNASTGGGITFYNHDGSGHEMGGVIHVVKQNGTSNNTQSDMLFGTRVNGSNVAYRARLTSHGSWETFSNTVNIDIANSQSSGNNEAFIYARYGSNALTNGSLSFRVYTNGNVANTNNSYGSISDVNLKENIVDATSQWDDIKALQVRKYNFREATGHQTHTQLGLIAQEVETVSPGLVETTAVREGETCQDADGNQLESIKSINYSVLYMKAVKALQEAQTRIETLETQNTAQQTQINDLITRVTALEG